MALTIFEAYNNTKKQLISAGIEDCVFEAKQIIKYVTGLNNMQILTRYSDTLTPFQENNLIAIIKQRQIHYPLQYILRSWDFYGRQFDVGPGVLIPRSDTETVIEVCLELLKGADNPEIADLCAGTGCIGITLAKEIPESRVLLVEKYKEAIVYTEKNIRKNNAVNAICKSGDVFTGDFSGKSYDMIVSNPPYISAKEIKELQPELKFEPETALLGGKDGLDFYRVIVKNYINSVKSGGKIVFEIGYSQGKAVAEILTLAGVENIEIRQDISGNDRVVFGTVNRI